MGPQVGITGKYQPFLASLGGRLSRILANLSLFLLVYEMGVSKNDGTPKSISIGFSIIHHPFWGIYPYFWKHPNNLHVTGKYNPLYSLNNRLGPFFKKLIWDHENRS